MSKSDELLEVLKEEGKYCVNNAVRIAMYMYIFILLDKLGLLDDKY